MLHRIKRVLWQFLLVGILAIFVFLGLVSISSQPGLAAVTQIKDTSGEVIYRSQRKLEDQSGRVWQVVLFKRVYPGEPVSVNLRLVGFPGTEELIHPQPLKITSATGQIWTAADIFLDEAPAPTIGQYNFKDILPQLPRQNLTLSIPLPGEKFINISVPTFVVREWKSVMSTKK